MKATAYFSHFIIPYIGLHASIVDAGGTCTSCLSSAFVINSKQDQQLVSNIDCSSSMLVKTVMGLQSSPLSFSPFMKCSKKTSCLQAGGGGFFDDLMNGNLFNSNNKDRDSSNKSKKEVTEGSRQNEEKNDDDNGDEFSWNESDFLKEVQKRNQNQEVVNATTVTTISGDNDSDTNGSYGNTNNNDIDENEGPEEEIEYDGYALRDAIYAKWGKCYDIDFQPVQSFGFRELYVNVLPFHLGGRRFRHETELDYLCHLQAVVEILVKYDQLDYVLLQLEETKKVPRAGTSPLVAVPFRLDLTEDELNSILS